MAIYTVENTSAIGRRVNVYLNGKELRHVLFADDVKGKVVVYRHPLKLHKYGKRALTKTIYGDVKVEALPSEAN